MSDEIKTAAGRINADKAIRVVVLAAAGKSFCAGGDLAWMRRQSEEAVRERVAFEPIVLENARVALERLPLDEQRKPSFWPP